MMGMIVSINSTSYKRSDNQEQVEEVIQSLFPLIPLLIKEAICIMSRKSFESNPVGFLSFH